MKKMRCELCGGYDILKLESSVFQCESCGCKYTPEQAKNLIKTPIPVIRVKSVDNLIEKAFAERRAGHREQAEVDLNQALELSPDDMRIWVAWMVLGTEERASYFYEKVKNLEYEISVVEKEMIEESKNPSLFLRAYLIMNDTARWHYVVAKYSEQLTERDCYDFRYAWLAMGTRDTKTIEFFLERDKGIENSVIYFWLWEMIEDGDPKVVEILLDKLAQPYDEETISALACVALTNSLDMFKLFLKFDFCIKGDRGKMRYKKVFCQEDVWYGYPLAYAVYKDSVKAAKILLEKGANPKYEVYHRLSGSRGTEYDYRNLHFIARSKEMEELLHQYGTTQRKHRYADE